LHAGCKPADALQHDFAELVLSGHTAAGIRAAVASSAAAAAAAEGLHTDARMTVPQHSAATIARAAAATAGQGVSCPAGHAVPKHCCIGKGPRGGSVCSSDKLQAKRSPCVHVAAHPEQQQLLTVCGLGAAALHLAQQ
jgi:hypothetical protein